MEGLGSIDTIAARRPGVAVKRNGVRRRRRPWLWARVSERTSRLGAATPPASRSRPEAVRSERDELIARRSGAEPAAAISALVGGVVSEHTGPRSKARTYLNGDVITVVLTDTLTKGEERLVRDGMSELVLGTRRAFQQTIRQDLVAGIEKITGRRVRVSASEMRPEITVEVLVLDSSPADDQAPKARQAL
jgi:uncharacterized protein YbcI